MITRTAGNEWVVGDQIGVFMTESAGTSIIDAKANVAYQASSSSSSSSFEPVSTVIYMPLMGEMVDFYAYYPHSQSVSESGIVGVDVSSGVAADIDLLRAESASHNADSPSVALQFEHRLAQITMNITRGNNISTSAQITAKVVGSMTTAEYNIFTDVISNAGSVADLGVQVANDQASVIVVPQTMATDAVVLFTVEGRDYRWDISNLTFNSGDNYSYNIQINQNELVVSSATITPWVSDSAGSGTAE